MIPPPTSDPAPPASPTRNRFGLTFLSLIFLAGGVLIGSFIINSFSAAMTQRSWPTADGVITRSTITDNQKPAQPNYRFDVAFTYTTPTPPFTTAQRMTATQLRTGYSGTNDYYDAQKLHDAYPIGSHATCWIDPANPQSAVLSRSSLFVGVFGAIPLLLLAIGIGGLYSAWFSSFSSRPRAQRNSQPQKAKGIGKAIFGLFFVIGVCLLIFVFMPTLQRGWNAKTWPTVPCTIVHSAISRHTGSKGGTTYGIEVLYRYEFNGKSYGSSKYGFMRSSSSSYYEKQDIVNSLPPRKKTNCYVDPADPAYAVLDRGYQSTALLALIPLAFAIIGVAGFFGRLGSSAPAAQETTVNVPGSMIGSLPIPKKPQTPATALLAAFLLAAFWNGIVSIFVDQLIVEWKRGNHDYFLALFLIPFVFVGMLLIGHVVYRIVKCFG